MSFNIQNRRYIGNKFKISEWIFDIIKSEVYNKKVFFDVFAGTGIISDFAINHFEEVIINDFLYSNEIIYRGFFEDSNWDEDKLKEIVFEFNKLDPDKLEDNYFSKNYGNKFFDYQNSKIIGKIRDELESLKNNLTNKEYAILLSSLIYSIDKISNTVGHFDAYIKKEIRYKKLDLRLINARREKN